MGVQASINLSMSTKKYTENEVFLIVGRSIDVFGLKNQKQLADLFEISPQDLNNRIQRGTVVKLIEKEAYKRSSNLRYILSGIHNQQDIQRHHCPLCGDMPDRIKDLCKKLKAVIESDNQEIAAALEANIHAFFGSVEKEKNRMKSSENYQKQSRITKSSWSRTVLPVLEGGLVPVEKRKYMIYIMF